MQMYRTETEPGLISIEIVTGTETETGTSTGTEERTHGCRVRVVIICDI